MCNYGLWYERINAETFLYPIYFSITFSIYSHCTILLCIIYIFILFINIFIFIIYPFLFLCKSSIICVVYFVLITYNWGLFYISSSFFVASGMYLVAFLYSALQSLFISFLKHSIFVQLDIPNTRYSFCLLSFLIYTDSNHPNVTIYKPIPSYDSICL